MTAGVGISTLTSEVRNIMGTVMKIDQASQPTACGPWQGGTCTRLLLSVEHCSVAAAPRREKTHGRADLWLPPLPSPMGRCHERVHLRAQALHTLCQSLAACPPGALSCWEPCPVP